jgi:hypothetical protein
MGKGEVLLLMAPPLGRRQLDAGVSRGAALRRLGVQEGSPFNAERVRDGLGKGGSALTGVIEWAVGAWEVSGGERRHPRGCKVKEGLGWELMSSHQVQVALKEWSVVLFLGSGGPNGAKPLEACLSFRAFQSSSLLRYRMSKQ